MVICIIILCSILAAGVGALAVRAVIRALRWMFRLLRLLLGLSLLALTVFYYYPRLFSMFGKKE